MLFKPLFHVSVSSAANIRVNTFHMGDIKKCVLEDIYLPHQPAVKIINRKTMPHFGINSFSKGSRLSNSVHYGTYMHRRNHAVSLLCFDSLRPSQQFFSHVRTGLPGLNHY